ncbi:MAG: hypothetical protein ACRD5M_00965 [Candidatus Acidiferrales bacterium]
MEPIKISGLKEEQQGLKQRCATHEQENDGCQLGFVVKALAVVMVRDPK